MLLNEITEPHDLRVSTMAKMIGTLIKKKVPVRIETRYENGEMITGNVHGMILKSQADGAHVELMYDMAMAGHWSKPQWTRLKPSEVERMELKKQSDGTYLLTVPNEEWEQLSLKSKAKKRVTQFAKRTLGLGGAEDRHSGV